MLKVVDLGVCGVVGAVTTGGVVFREVRLEDFLSEEEALLRSTEVLVVWRDCGRWKGLELLVSDMVAVAEEADQARRLRVLGGKVVVVVGDESGWGSWGVGWGSWEVEGSGEAVEWGGLAECLVS